MKHNFKRFILPVALMLAVILVLSVALAESTLNGLWKSGTDLLFHTSNVTVKGEASFSLDGEHFKTMQLDYVQDGFNSYYGLKLLTPRDDGTERETGWTIIAEKDEYYVMEAFYPGTYRTGTDEPQDTLLRRTVQLDALTDLGGLVAAQVEAMLPEDALTVTETDGGKTVHLSLKADQVPPLAVSALNTAAGYLCNRWFLGGYDHTLVENEYATFDKYITVTQALTDGTARWELRAVDADCTLDAQGRLTGLKGELTVQSIYWDGVARDIGVKFDFTVSDYGKSRVKRFDPADYGVELYWDWITEQMYGEEENIGMDEDAWDEWVGRTVKLLEAQGYAVRADAYLDGWVSDGYITICVTNPSDDFFCTFTEDGYLTSLQNLNTLWMQAEEETAPDADAETLKAAESLIRSFIADVNPALTEKLTSLTPQSAITAMDGSRYLTFRNMGPDGTHFVVRIEPDLRLEYFAINDEE